MYLFFWLGRVFAAAHGRLSSHKRGLLCEVMWAVCGVLTAAACLLVGHGLSGPRASVVVAQ